MSELETQTVKCADCGNDLEITIQELWGHKIPSRRYCDDCGEKRRNKKRQEEKAILQQQENEKRIRWLRECGIPPRYIEKGFNDLIERGGNSAKVLKACEKYIGNYPPERNNNYKSFYLFSHGIWGIGKTHIVCSMAKELMKKWLRNSEKCPLLYTTESNMFLRIRATFNQYASETEEGVYKQLTRIPLLIVDDVGKEEVNDPKFVQRVWFAIVNGRYDNLLPLIITANLDPDGLAHHLGGSRNNEASWDRLLEMFDGEIWQLEAPSSYRREKYNGLSDK